MATTISKLAILLSLNSQGVTSGLAQAGAAVKSFQGQVGSFGSKFLDDLGGALIGRLGGVMTATAAVDAATRLWHQGLQGVLETVERIGGQVDMAGWVGIEQADLARLQYVAELSGVAEDAVGKSLAKMQDFIAGAASAGSAQAGVLAKLGLSSGDFAGMDASQRFLAIANAIDKIEDPARQVQVAMDVFGKTGAQLLPIFNAGADAIAGAMKQADRFGLALSSVDANAVDEVGDRMADVEKAIEGAYNALVVEGAPAMTESLKAITELIVFAKENAEGLYIAWYALSMPALWPVRLAESLADSSGLLSRAVEETEAMARAAEPLRDVKPVENAEAIADAAERTAAAWTDTTAAMSRALEADAERLMQSLMTPGEQFDQQMARIFEHYGSGFLSDDFFARAVAQAEEEFQRASAQAERVHRRDVAEPQIGLLERGSAAAFSAERAGKSELSKLVANSDRALIYDEKAAAEMEELNRQWREKGEVTLSFQPIT